MKESLTFCNCNPGLAIVPIGQSESQTKEQSRVQACQLLLTVNASFHPHSLAWPHGRASNCFNCIEQVVKGTHDLHLR